MTLENWKFLEELENIGSVGNDWKNWRILLVRAFLHILTNNKGSQKIPFAYSYVPWNVPEYPQTTNQKKSADGIYTFHCFFGSPSVT